MTTLLFMPAPCFEHDTGYGHPECAERLKVLDSVFHSEAFLYLLREDNGPATREQLERAHKSDYIDHILSFDGCTKPIEIDEDTVISAGTAQAALYGAGAACSAVDQVVTNRARNAFCAIRPPGHHAEPDQGMGFCLFNNAAIAALQARRVHSVEKIAIIDFDVHHGNGIQSICWDDENLFYISLHEEGGFPETGYPQETGKADNILNVVFHHEAGSKNLRRAWDAKVEMRLRDFAPDLVIISAGFDGHERDHMGGLHYTTGDYAWMTEKIVRVANDCCKGKVVSLLEGGYDLPSLATAAAVHVKVLMEV